MSPFTLGNTEATRIVLESMAKRDAGTPQDQAVTKLGNGIVSSNSIPVLAVQNNPQTIQTQQVLQNSTNSSSHKPRGWTSIQITTLKELGKRKIEVKQLLKNLDWESIAKSLNKEIKEIKARLTDLNLQTITRVTSDDNWTKDEDAKLQELVGKKLKLQKEWKDKLVWNKIAKSVGKGPEDCRRKFKSEFQNKKPVIQPSSDRQSISFEKAIVYASYQILSNSNKTSNNKFPASSRSSSETLPNAIDLTDDLAPPPKKAKIEEKSDQLEKMRISYLICEEKTPDKTLLQIHLAKTNTDDVVKLPKKSRKRKRTVSSTESEDKMDEDEINHPAPSLPYKVEVKQVVATGDLYPLSDYRLLKK